MLPAGLGCLEEEQLLSWLPRALRETGEAGRGLCSSLGHSRLG